MLKKKSRLMSLFIPIFLELLFTMLTGVVDTFMLASEGDKAVGAVGTANSYISVFLIMFSIISSGMLAVMTQYIGAQRPGVAKQALRLGLGINAGVGIAFSGLLCFCAGPILDIVGIAAELREPAKIYMQTVGAFSICSALIPIYSGYLRAFGHTSPPLRANMLANISNLILNALFLYVLKMGVFGIALATGISRLLNMLWVLLASRKLHGEIQDDGRHLPMSEILGKMLKVGLPGALESLMYNVSVMLVISLLNRMDSSGMQAIGRAYTAQIAQFSFCAGCALAQANAIMVGWRIGAGELDECDRETRRNAVIGILLGGVLAGVFAIFFRPVLSIFTDDPMIMRLVSALLIVEIPLEIGRAVNMVFGWSLKASGDAVYTLIIAIIFMTILPVGGSWYLGIKLGWLAVGAYVGMALDECGRAVFMYLRWNKGIWRTKNLVTEN